jgi:hypothetical protein
MRVRTTEGAVEVTPLGGFARLGTPAAPSRAAPRHGAPGELALAQMLGLTAEGGRRPAHPGVDRVVVLAMLVAAVGLLVMVADALR